MDRNITRIEEAGKPSELMSDEYYEGPSKMIPLSDIPNTDNFRFIGIDKHGGEHYCIVLNRDNAYYMFSDTVTFHELIGWIPDKMLRR